MARSPSTRDACSCAPGKSATNFARNEQGGDDDQTAVVSVEQLVPFPSHELAAEFGRYAKAKDFVWVQEEPANMGARAFMMPRLRATARRTAVAFGAAFCVCEPRHRIGEGARHRTADTARYGVRK